MNCTFCSDRRLAIAAKSRYVIVYLEAPGLEPVRYQEKMKFEIDDLPVLHTI